MGFISQIDPVQLENFLHRNLANNDWIKDLSREELEQRIQALDPRPEFHLPLFTEQLGMFLIGIQNPNYLFYADMGIGKSATALNLISYYKKLGKVKKALILVTNLVLIQNWLDECQKQVPKLKAIGVYGSKKERIKALSTEADLYIFNYAGVQALLSTGGRKREIEKKDVTEFASDFDIVIYDEAQPLTSKILTPTGWKLMGEMAVNDPIIGIDGDIYNILKIFPKGMQNIYEIEFNDGTKTSCTENHLWEVSEHNRKQAPKIIKTIDLFKSKLTYENKYGKTYRYHIPWVSSPIKLNNIELLPISPYVLGFLIGDGSFTGTGHYKQISFATADLESVTKLEKLLPNTSISKVGKYHFNIKNNYLADLLMYLGLWGCYSYNKFIPHIYKYASIQERTELLQGLLDTDGYVSQTGNTIEYVSISERLIEDLNWIVYSLGGHTKLYLNYDRRHLNTIYYKLRIMLPDSIIPFSLSRKVSRYKPNQKLQKHKCINKITLLSTREETQCIMTDAPRGLYITDDYIVTHNCTAVQNHQSLTYKVCNTISDYVPYNYGLAGRPFGRNPEALWAQFHVIDKGETLHKSFWFFKTAFFKPTKKRWGIDWKFKSELNDDLKRLLKNKSIRYKAIPKQEPVRILLKVDSPEENKKYLAKVIEDIRKHAKNHEVEKIKGSFMQMREIASNFLNYKIEDETQQIVFSENPKLELLITKILEAPEDRQILVFHDFIYSGEQICKALTKNGINHRWVYGKTPPALKLQYMSEFKNNSDIKVLVLNSASGALGLNLQNATIVFFYESPVPPVIREQAEARTRFATVQTKTVYIYDLVVRDSVEERILSFIQEGKDLLHELIEGKVEL